MIAIAPSVGNATNSYSREQLGAYPGEWQENSYSGNFCKFGTSVIVCAGFSLNANPSATSIKHSSNVPDTEILCHRNFYVLSTGNSASADWGKILIPVRDHFGPTNDNSLKAFEATYAPLYETPIFEAEKAISSELTESTAIMEKIIQKRLAVILLPDAVEVADAVIRDAKVLLSKNTIYDIPLIFFDEDGILVLQWQKGKTGVALVFAGDGTVSIGFAGPNQFYSSSNLEVTVDRSLPLPFTDALKSVRAS